MHPRPHTTPNQRVVSQPDAFTAYYADTLGADGTAPLHSCGGGGAAIGVVDNATVADLPATDAARAARTK